MTEEATDTVPEHVRDDLLPEGGPHVPNVTDGNITAISDTELQRLTHDIIAALKTVYDPEIPSDVYEIDRKSAV